MICRQRGRGRNKKNGSPPSGTPGLPTNRDHVQQPSNRPVAGCPAPWSSGSHQRPCLLASSFTGAYLEPSSRHRSRGGALVHVGTRRASHIRTQAANLHQRNPTSFDSQLITKPGKSTSRSDTASHPLCLPPPTPRNPCADGTTAPNTVGVAKAGARAESKRVLRLG